ncbi:response regulator [uncultured Oceanisphaera sp.]|uniref:response regulator n=1 Tax=uncultured Oceanisphaera sp. TaxID=353858 RepID=UPI002613089F|nr:response regulator [uncultured Oceanisphaera sp.]
MPVNKKDVIFIATNSHSTAEVVNKMLAVEFEHIVVSTSIDHVVGEFDRADANVILLAYKDVEQSENVYGELCLRSRHLHSKPYKCLLLCNKLEAKLAYELCRSRKFDNYIVFWPLSYDPFRLLMSVHQAITEINETYQLREKVTFSSEQDKALTDLEALFVRQVEGSHTFSVKVNNAVETVEKNIRRVIGEVEHAKEAVSGFWSNDEAEDHNRENTPVYSLDRIRQGVESIRSFANELDAFSSDNVRSSYQLSQASPKSRISVMVVEDDAFQRNLLLALLRSDDYDVDFAASGEEAINLLQRSTPDLILMDIMMPGISGIETTRFIKANSWTKNIPIIIISGKNERDVILECINLGASSFVLKPFNRQTIMKKVSAVLNINQ